MIVEEYYYFLTYLKNLKIFYRQEREKLNPQKRMKITAEMLRIEKLLKIKE